MKWENCLIDLHLHLDGSLSPASARALARMQDIKIPESDGDLLALLSVEEDCRDLNVYLQKFAFPGMLLQTEAALTAAVSTLLAELKEQGLIYTEIRFAPQKHRDKGLTQRQVIEAAIAGLRDEILPAGLILCCMRGGENREANLETVRLAKEYLGRGVVAIDLAGAEGLFPTADFEEVFSLAKELGVPCTIHAGEGDGPESVRAALRFGAKRIGHGVRSVEDPALLGELAEQGVTLECCPTSNLQTRVFAHISQYPVRAFLDAGVKFTINTDNLSVSATDLRREWQLILDAFALTEDEVRTILLDAAEAAFAPAEEKRRLREKIEAAFA